MMNPPSASHSPSVAAALRTSAHMTHRRTLASTPLIMLSALVSRSSGMLVGSSAPRAAVARRHGKAFMHTLIYPHFKLNDLAAAKPFMDKCVESTKNERGCLYYGWTVSEDESKLFCRETYVDGKAASTHFINAVPIIGEMLESGAVALDTISVMGTEADLADVKEEADKLGAQYWTVWDSFSNFKIGDAPSSEKFAGSFTTIQPIFTLVDQAKAEPFMKRCVEATKSEAGCLYYGWTISGDKLFCREAYVDGAAVSTHLTSAVVIVGEMLESGAATLDSIEIHGPKSEWGAFKEQADGLGAAYYDVDASFGKFKM